MFDPWGDPAPVNQDRTDIMQGGHHRIARHADHAATLRIEIVGYKPVAAEPDMAGDILMLVLCAGTSGTGNLQHQYWALFAAFRIDTADLVYTATKGKPKPVTELIISNG